MSGILVGRYEYVEQLGVGGFGVVDHYRDLITGDNVAIKTIPASCIHRESKRLIREVDILCFLYNAHPHVVGYFNMFVTRSNDDDGSGKASSRGGGVLDANGVYTLPASDVPADLYVLGPQYASLSTHEKLVRHHERLRAHVTQLQRGVPFHLHIVMPLMKGDLLNFIGLVAPGSRARSTQGLTREFVAQVSVVFAFQICFGLDYLHKSHILHRDMKPDNVLVRLDVSNPYMSSALITDLGLARDAHESDTFYICTRYYRPPEMITNSSKGSPAVDVWSLGCIFYEMCTSKVLLSLKSALRDGMWDGGKASNQLEEVLNTLGTPTHADIHRYMPDGNAKLYLLRSVPRESQLPQLIRQHWQLAVSAEEQRLWIDLITRCLAFFPQQRPTAEQLCCHALFRRYRILYGENVKQYEARKYTPTYADAALSNSLQAENKAMVLELVRHALMQTMPDPDEDASDVSGDSDAEAAAAASDADSSEREEKDEDEFDDNHDDRNSNVSDDSSDANDYDLHNHHHHHDNGNNNRHVASGAHPPHAYMRSTAAAIAEALPPLRTHDAQQQQQQQQQQRRQHAAAHKTHDEDDDEDDDGGGGYHVVARSDSDSDSDDDIGLAVRRAAAAVETDSDDAHGGSDDGDDGAATRTTAAAAAAARPHAQTTTAMTTRRVSSPHNGYASAPSGSGHGGGGGPLGGVYGQPNDLCMSSLLMQPLLQQRQQHVLQRADNNKSTHSNNGNNNGKSEDDEDASSDDADHTTAATATTRAAASAEQQRMRPQLRFLHSFTAQVRTPETSQPFAEPTGLQHMRSNSNSSSSSSSTSSDNSDNSDSDEDNDDNNRHNNDDDDDDDAASDNDNSSDDGLRSSIAGLAVSRSEAQPMMSFYPSLYAHSHDDGKQSALGYHDNGSSSNNSSGGVGGGGDATAALYSPAYLSPLQSKMTQSQQPSALYHTQPLHRGGASSSATTATAMQQPSFTTMYAANNNNNGHGDGSLTAQAASSSPARMQQQQQQQRGGAMSYGVASGKGSSHPHASASAALSGGAAAAAAAAAKDSSFPTHLDEALRERYSKFGRSEADVQRAIGQLLGDMEDCRRDAARSRQLRELLRYFNTLQSSEPTDVGRESSGYVYS